jgi:hypothetical protein
MFERAPNGYFLRDLIVFNGLSHHGFVAKGFIFQPPELTNAQVCVYGSRLSLKKPLSSSALRRTALFATPFTGVQGAPSRDNARSRIYPATGSGHETATPQRRRWHSHFFTQAAITGDNMKIRLLIPLGLAVALMTGCSTTRPISAVAMGAGGAALASELSDGDPAITAAGAAGGVLLSEGIHYASKKQADRAYANGYEKGRSDAVKQQYWILVNQQKLKPWETGDNVRLYEIPIPEQKIDGVILKPTTKYLRIEE